jgi:SAM-dependent methyltransferase
MLQLTTAGYIAIENVCNNLGLPVKWQTQEELETVTNRYHQAFLDERFEVSKTLGGFFLAHELIDRSIRTEEQERMDNPSLTATQKIRLIKALDNMNNMMSLYPRYISIIEPSIRKIAKEKKRPARILELASGAGGFALAIAAKAKQSSLPVEITGSDIVEEYVEYGNRVAEEQNLPVLFKTINAFELDALDTCACDIILISQSLHHFTPGQLARIIVQSRLHGAAEFLGLDGHRGTDVLAGVPLMAMLQGISALTLDGYTSARKFYSELELDLIARIATGSMRHTIEFSWPLTVLDIPFE